MNVLVQNYEPVKKDMQYLHRIVIVPSDPWTLIGAKGDEAMMQAVIQRLRQINSKIEVAVITATPRQKRQHWRWDLTHSTLGPARCQNALAVSKSLALTQ